MVVIIAVLGYFKEMLNLYWSELMTWNCTSLAANQKCKKYVFIIRLHWFKKHCIFPRFFEKLVFPLQVLNCACNGNAARARLSRSVSEWVSECCCRSGSCWGQRREVRHHQDGCWLPGCWTSRASKAFSNILTSGSDIWGGVTSRSVGTSAVKLPLSKTETRQWSPNRLTTAPTSCQPALFRQCRCRTLLVRTLATFVVYKKHNDTYDLQLSTYLPTTLYIGTNLQNSHQVWN